VPTGWFGFSPFHLAFFLSSSYFIPDSSLRAVHGVRDRASVVCGAFVILAPFSKDPSPH